MCWMVIDSLTNTRRAARRIVLHLISDSSHRHIPELSLTDKRPWSITSDCRPCDYVEQATQVLNDSLHNNVAKRLDASFQRKHVGDFHMQKWGVLDSSRLILLQLHSRKAATGVMQVTPGFSSDYTRRLGMRERASCNARVLRAREAWGEVLGHRLPESGAS